MAEARIGTKIQPIPGGSTIEVPSDWDEADALEWAKTNAPKLYETAMQAQYAPAHRPPKPTALERLGGGFSDIGMGAKDLLGLASDEEIQRFQEGVDVYDRARRGEGIDLLRLGGQALATLPMAALGAPATGSMGLLGRAGVGAMEGALAGGLLYAPDDATRARNMAFGGGGGAVANVFAPAIGTGIEKAVGGIQRGANVVRSLRTPSLTVTFDDAVARAKMPADEITPALREAFRAQGRAALRHGRQLDPDAALRRARIEAAGYTGKAKPTRGQITRDPDLYSDERNAAAMPGGESIQRRYLAQEARTGERFDDLRRAYGGLDDPQDMRWQAGQGVEEAVQQEAERRQKAVSGAFRAAREERPGAYVKAEAFEQELGDTFQTYRNSAPKDLKNRVDELIAAKRISPEDLEQLDTLATTFYGQDKAANTVVHNVKRAARRAMDAMGDEYGGSWKKAMKLASDRFKAIYGKRKNAKNVTAKFYEDLGDPQTMTQSLMAGPPREISRLRDFIAADHPEAWARARTSVWNEITEAAFPSGEFKQASFNRVVRRMGPERLKLIFGDDGAREIRELAQATRDLFAIPNFHRVNFSHSGTLLMGMFDRMGRIFSSTPLMAELGAGLKAVSRDAATQRTAKLALDALPAAPITPPPVVSRGIVPLSRALAPAGGLISAERYNRR